MKFGYARFLIAGALTFVPCLLRAQDRPPVIRSISIETQNIFDSAQAQTNFFYCLGFKQEIQDKIFSAT